MDKDCVGNLGSIANLFINRANTRRQTCGAFHIKEIFLLLVQSNTQVKRSEWAD